MRPFVLVVTAGPDAGARLVLDAAPKTIGRSRSSDLVVTDPGLSRAHLEVAVDGERVRVSAAPGTAALVIDGVEVREAALGEGQVFVIAATAFAIARSPIDAGEMRTGQATQLRGLLQGLAADVKSLRSIADLVDALDRAESEEALAPIIDAWGRTEAGAAGVRLVRGEALKQQPELAPLHGAHDAIVSVLDGPRPFIAVTAHGAEPYALVASFDAGTTEVAPGNARLLGVAGRIVGSALARIARQQSLEAEAASLRTLALGSARAFLGHSPAAIEVSRLVARLAASDATALVLGESGTGKSFVARLIHEASPRAREPFRVINCAAIPESLLESELFGHERGAFSGAVTSHAGAFEAVGRGTLFLDEIGELALASQAKLLRVLEERKFERVGSNRTQAVEARVLAATNRDLGAMVEKGQFRQDLFFRVSVVTVRVPPLRDRGEDVVLLARRMLADAVASAGRRIAGFSPDALEAIRTYPWPGNVRELRNAIEHAVVLGDGPNITLGDLPETIRGAVSARRPEANDDPDVVRLPARLDWLEERAIEAALRATAGNRTKAAALLGINRVTLYKKLREDDA